MAPGDGEHGVPVGDVLQAGRRNASESDLKSVAPPVTVCQIDDEVMMGLGNDLKGCGLCNLTIEGDGDFVDTRRPRLFGIADQLKCQPLFLLQLINGQGRGKGIQ